MEMRDYLLNSKRTLSSGFHYTTPELQTEVHGAIGINTEVTELFKAVSNRRMDTVNLSEEVADVHWYLAIFQRNLGFLVSTSSETANSVSFNSINDLIVDTAIHSGQLLDIYKKLGFYNKPIDVDRVQHLCNLISLNTVVMCEWIGIPLEVCLDRNIQKLKARFPEKFTEENAQIRNLKVERNILEGSND